MPCFAMGEDQKQIEQLMGGWGDKIRQKKIAVGQEFPCLWCSLQWWAGQLCSSVHSLFFSNMSVVKQMSKQAAAASFNLIPSCGKACPAAAGRVWRGSSPFLTCFFLTSNFSSSSPISSSHTDRQQAGSQHGFFAGEKQADADNNLQR